MARKTSPLRDSATQRGYGHAWRKARAAYLRAHPLCVECHRFGRTTAAAVVDHRVPHQGNRVLFWDSCNWQALCKHCHDSHKQRAEKSGAQLGCDLNGLPLDARHHWR